MNFTNKVVVITGAGSGIGHATSILFDSLGANVVASDLNHNSVEELTCALQNESLALQTDVSSFDQMENLISKTVSHFGKIDILVNNAGIGPKRMRPVHDFEMEDWDNVVAVNQTGVFYGMKCALTQMVLQGQGNIVNVASLAGLKASGHNISYSASKFAVVGMTKSAALEYAKKNIRINAVCPGYTETRLLDQLFSAKGDMEDKLRGLIPMNRFGDPKEIAEAIAWLASDHSSFITGQTMTLDGGTSL